MSFNIILAIYTQSKFQTGLLNATSYTKVKLELTLASTSAASVCSCLWYDETEASTANSAF